MIYTRKKVAGILLTLGCLVCIYIVSSITYMIILKAGVGGFSDPPHWILVLSDSKTIPIPIPKPNPGLNSNPMWPWGRGSLSPMS